MCPMSPAAFVPGLPVNEGTELHLDPFPCLFWEARARREQSMLWGYCNNQEMSQHLELGVLWDLTGYTLP